MPSTAEQIVQALRVNFGVPKAARAMEFMEAWLKEHCRDWMWASRWLSRWSCTSR